MYRNVIIWRTSLNITPSSYRIKKFLVKKIPNIQRYPLCPSEKNENLNICVSLFFLEIKESIEGHSFTVFPYHKFSPSEKTKCKFQSPGALLGGSLSYKFRLSNLAKTFRYIADYLY